MNAHSGIIKTAHFQYTVGYIIIIIKAIYNAQDPPKAANALSGSEKVWLSIYNVSYKQQCLQRCPKSRETSQTLVTQEAGCSTQKVRKQQSFYLRSLCLFVEQLAVECRQNADGYGRQ